MRMRKSSSGIARDGRDGGRGQFGESTFDRRSCLQREPVPQHGDGREGNMGGASIIIGEFALPSSRTVQAEAGRCGGAHIDIHIVRSH